MSDYYDLSDPVVKALYRARTELLSSKPLLGEIALEMDLVVLDEPKHWCPRAATDGKSIFFVRAFVISLFYDSNQPKTKRCGGDRLVAIIAHEIWHRLFGHLLRRGNRDDRYWAMAIDYVVNAAIVEDKIGLLPTTALYDRRFTSEMTCEEVYDYLVANKVEYADSLDYHIEPADQAKNPGTGLEDTTIGDLIDASMQPHDGGMISAASDDFAPSPLSAAEVEMLKDKSVLSALNTLMNEEAAGLGSSGLYRQIMNIVEHKMNWRSILQTSLRSLQPHDWTYDELSDITWASWLYFRNHWTEDSPYQKGYCAILPAQTEGDRVEATIAIDTSASMSSHQISQILAEVGGILESFHEVELRIICFDGEVTSVECFTKEELFKLKEFKAKRIKGGGGTDFMSVWDYLKAERIVPHRLIIATDGLPGGSWGDPDYCETIFLINETNKTKTRTAPFGMTTYLE